MPTLTIEGRRVRVGDTFLTMTPDQQGAAVEEIAGSLGITASPESQSPAMREALEKASRASRDFFGEASTQPDTYGGTAMNATAGVNEGIYGLPGYLVDGMAGLMNLGVRGVNYATGADLPTIDDPMFGSRHLQRMIGGAAGELHPALDPANTRARTTEERVARSAGEAVGSSVAGAGLVGSLSRAGTLSVRQAEVAGNLLGRSSSAGIVAGEAAVSGAAGAGASAAAELVPEKWKPLAALGGLLAGGATATAAALPAAARGGTQALGDAVRPFSREGRNRLAADRLRQGASDPGALRTSLDVGSAEIVPGSLPTTGQASGDMGILAMERAAQTRRPDLFQQRRADQNAARLDALDTLQPAGSPEAVSAAVRQRLDAIDRRTQDALDAAEADARLSAASLGRGMTPETAGEALRGSYEAARAAAKAEERRLWQAVDPDGSLVAPLSQTRQAAAAIVEDIPRLAEPMSPQHAAIFQAIGGIGDAVPFRELTALRSRLGDALRQERRANGESQAYRHLSMLRSALEGDVDAVISGRVAQEAEAVAAGTMRADQTIVASLQLEQEGFLAGREADARVVGSGGGPVGYGARGSSPIPGLRRTAGSEAGRSGAAPSDPGLAGGQSLPPNLDGAARERLSAATNATRNRVATFDNPTLAPIRRRPSTAAPYDMPVASVAARLFSGGSKSPEAIAAYRRAVADDPAALGALEGYAVDRLMKAALRDDGTLDPGKLATWRRSHADALRAFPELDARFADAGRASETIAFVARERKAALDEAQAGALGRLIGVEGPQDVVRIVGGLFGREDATRRMLELRQAIGDNRQAIQGLRKAVAEHMTARLVGNTEAGTSGRATIRSDQFQTFVRQSKSVLRAAGFSEAEIKVMQDIGDDLQRANRSLAAVRIPGQSNTAQDIVATSRDLGGSILRRVVFGVGAGAGGILYSGSITGAVAGAFPELLGSMRAAGLRSVDDIVTDALLNPEKARLLLAKPSRQTEKATLQWLGQLYRKGAVTASAEAMRQTGGPDGR